MRYEIYNVSNANQKGLFSCTRGVRLTKSERVVGKIPLVTAGVGLGQGVAEYITDTKKMTLYKDDITIDMFGIVFYHDYAHYGDDNIHFLVNDTMDYKVKLFIATILDKKIQGFSYGNQFRMNTLNNLTIKLPTLDTLDENSPYSEEGYIPDFDYMREKIMELEQEKIMELEQNLITTGLNDYELTKEDIETLSGLCNYKELDNNDNIKTIKKMREFKLENLFISENGDTDLQKMHINGLGYNVVSSGLENNGVIGKTDVKAKVFKSNTITIDMFGYAFYRDMPYKMVTHGRVFSLSPRFDNFNELNGQFIVSALKYLPSIYNYGNMCSWEKIKMHTLYLPIQTDENNNPIIDTTYEYHSEGYIPDWDFMEKYIKVIEKLVIADVVKYKDDYIEKIKMVVNW